MAKAAEGEKPKRKYVRRKPGASKGAAPAAPAANPGDSPAPASSPKADKTFAFDLKQQVTISQSGEGGTVRARAEWATGNVSYFVAYTSTAGEFKEAWIDQDLLEAFKERRRKRA